MGTDRTGRHRVVVVGGGLAGIEAALYLRSAAGDLVDVTIVSDHDQFTYRPFLTYVAFGLSPDRVHLDLKKIADEHDLRLIVARVDRVVADRHLIQFGSQFIPYDSLILATGARTKEEPIPGLRRGLTVWSEHDMMRLHKRMTRAIEESSPDRPTRVVFLVPPGAAWTGPLYEIALMTATWLRWSGHRESFDLRLVTSEERHIGVLGPDLQEHVAKSLAYHGIECATSRHAVRVDEGRVVLREGSDLPFDVLISAAVYQGAGPHEGLSVDDDHFYRTDRETRRLVGSDRIYAIGDGSDYPLKQGFVALLQADAAAEQIAATVLDREPSFTFTATVFWLMEEFDQVLFAHDAGETPGHHVTVEKLPTERLRRLEAMGYLPREQRLANPLYSGLMWKGTEIGLTLLKQLEKGGDV